MRRSRGWTGVLRAVWQRLQRLWRAVRGRLVTAGDEEEPAVTAWPLPQLPDRAATAATAAVLADGHGAGLLPNRLPRRAEQLAGGVAVPGDLGSGPWRDLGSSVRAASAAAAVQLVAPALSAPWAAPAVTGAADPLDEAARPDGPDGPDGPVVCRDEEHRGWVEWAHPELVGRVEVAGHRERWRARHERTSPAPDAPRLGVVGYDLKFLRSLLDVLERRGVLVADVDEWPKFRVHDEEATRATIEAADVVLAEWCGPNAVLASRLVRPDQRLVVRLHRFELGQPEWREVHIDAVDTVVAVSEPYRRRILEVTGWPADKVVVVPNAVDVHHLDREKLDSARWTLGMLGVDRSRKRLDRALDVLAQLRAEDPRWQLRVKGTSPWDSGWVADRDDEVAWFAAQLRRLDDEPLRSGVVFDPRGPDVASWLRGIGHLVSASEDESFHLAPAEAMASGAVPLLWPWPGSDEIYDEAWVVQDAADAAARAAAVAADPAAFRAAGARAHDFVAERFRLEDVAAGFGAVLLGRPDPRS